MQIYIYAPGLEILILFYLATEEKINKIRWLKRKNPAHFLLSTNGELKIIIILNSDFLILISYQMKGLFCSFILCPSDPYSEQITNKEQIFIILKYFLYKNAKNLFITFPIDIYDRFNYSRFQYYWYQTIYQNQNIND